MSETSQPLRMFRKNTVYVKLLPSGNSFRSLQTEDLGLIRRLISGDLVKAFFPELSPHLYPLLLLVVQTFILTSLSKGLNFVKYVTINLICYLPI